MTLGNKIKRARLEKKMTQEKLCGDKITRNMLSAIENDKATPSFDTLNFLANSLSLPLSYLLSSDDDLFVHKKGEMIEEIKSEFTHGNYEKCVDIIKELNSTDDELSYILAYCYFEIGRRFVLRGALRSGYENLKYADEYCKATIYDTSKIESQLLIYTALATNIQSPLLVFDAKKFEHALDNFDFEFYKYLVQDVYYPYKNPLFSNHIKARELIKLRKYFDAIPLLKQIENDKTPETYNSCVMFSVYNDLENCYKQLADFENAYRYASKKMSLIEAFKN